MKVNRLSEAVRNPRIRETSEPRMWTRCLTRIQFILGSLNCGGFTYAKQLLMLHGFVDDGFPALVHGNDFVNRNVTGHSDINDVIAGIEHDIDW
jgi:hypothetical protein